MITSLRVQLLVFATVGTQEHPRSGSVKDPTICNDLYPGQRCVYRSEMHAPYCCLLIWLSVQLNLGSRHRHG